MINRDPTPLERPSGAQFRGTTPQRCLESNASGSGASRSWQLSSGPQLDPSPVATARVCDKARPRGFEPLTVGLEIRCSILLSYGRVTLVSSCIVTVFRLFVDAPFLLFDTRFDTR